MKSTKEHIEDLKKNGYSLEFETVFNLAFENYKKIAIYAGLLILVFTVFFIIASLIIIGFTYGLENFQQLITPGNFDPKNLTDKFLLTYIGSITLLNCLISPFLAGLIKMAHFAQIDQEFHVANVFEYYRFSYFKELFLATLIITILSMGFSSMLDATGIPMLGFMVSLTISVLNILTIPLIIFSKFNAVEAITTSINLVLKQPLLLFALMIIVYLAILTGIFFFFIGFFFTLPFMYSMYYAVYSCIIGFRE
ncbi:hypothetical protein GCM10008015_23250 [Flavobacterium palustre]|uniref:Beta-carotene 15,15'-monooxygenase n=1 Tax=Flavobacterium palustre TaxID=1476463 RepID=A0ABQ1HM34_9FLAO|nr:hypothetical protein [Flavobacterium palustre]GGA81852.1 hypothetical protein GCM10008015_23250 [Flavobacterium palustre]